MARLKNRQLQIPGGLKFFQPETRWQPPAFASFNVIVQNLITHRNANPGLRDSKGWATDQTAVENEVDEFNARICEQMGWTEFIQAQVGGAPAPFIPAPSLIDQSKLNAAAGAVKKIWAGVRTLNDWLESEEPAVSDVQSAARAAVCAVCPKNVPGDFSTWFTKPASEAIRLQLEKVKNRKLSTPSDELLNVCDVCLCPMKLKVHTPMKYVNAHLTQGILDELASANSNCWIIAERKV
jgi:hypothetical protein